RDDNDLVTRGHQIRSALCVPLRIARGAPGESPRTIGVLYVDSRDVGRFISQTGRAAIDALADEAALAIQLYRESIEKLRVEHEMQAAARVQRNLLPARFLAAGPFEIAGQTVPCLEVGGDFLDYLGDSELMLFAEADVEGKGLPAAILGAKVAGMFSASAQFVRSPAELTEQMNRALCRVPERGRFVPLACATLGADGHLATCSAGHNPALVLRGHGGLEELTAGGIPLGIADWVYQEESTSLEPGDLVVLYSDGVNECENARGEQFGMERVRD